MAICPNDSIGLLSGHVRCVRIASSQARLQEQKISQYIHDYMGKYFWTDSVTQTPVLMWPCSLVYTLLLLLQTFLHRICSEFTKSQALLYLNLSWHAWSFILTCLNRIFFLNMHHKFLFSSVLNGNCSSKHLEPVNLKAWTGTMKARPL